MLKEAAVKLAALQASEVEKSERPRRSNDNQHEKRKVIVMKKFQSKCNGCERRTVLRAFGPYRLCDECRSNRDVLRKLKIYRPQDLCSACSHSAAEHGLGDEAERIVSKLYACRGEGCECNQFHFSPA